jgi:hypothetical protein
MLRIVRAPPLVNMCTSIFDSIIYFFSFWMNFGAIGGVIVVGIDIFP